MPKQRHWVPFSPELHFNGLSTSHLTENRGPLKHLLTYEPMLYGWLWEVKAVLEKLKVNAEPK